MVFGFLSNLNPLKWFKSSKNQTTSPNVKSRSNSKSKSPKSKTVSRECTPAESICSQTPSTSNCDSNENGLLHNSDMFRFVTTQRGSNACSSLDKLLNQQQESSEVERIVSTTCTSLCKSQIPACASSCDSDLEANFDRKDVEMMIIDINRSQSIDESPHPAALNWQVRNGESNQLNTAPRTPPRARTPPSTRTSKKRRRSSTDAPEPTPVVSSMIRSQRKIPRMGITPIQAKKSFKKSPPLTRARVSQMSRIITNVSASNLRKIGMLTTPIFTQNGSDKSVDFSTPSLVLPGKRNEISTVLTTMDDIDMESPLLSSPTNGVEDSEHFNLSNANDEPMELEDNCTYSGQSSTVCPVSVTPSLSDPLSNLVFTTPMAEKMEHSNESSMTVDQNMNEYQSADVQIASTDYTDIKPDGGRKPKSKISEFNQSLVKIPELRRSGRQRRSVAPYGDSSFVYETLRSSRRTRDRSSANAQKNTNTTIDMGTHMDLRSKLGYVPVLANLKPMRLISPSLVAVTENVPCDAKAENTASEKLVSGGSKYSSGDSKRKVRKSHRFVPVLENLRESSDNESCPVVTSAIPNMRLVTIRARDSKLETTANNDEKC